MPTDLTAIPPARVLIVDDEPQIRRFLDISLRAQGYRVLQAGTAEEGMALLAGQGAELVVLDIGLPDRDGHEMLREIRQWSNVPVIMLTVRAGETEKVAALDAGANDYVTKPFGVQELMARIRVLLRQAGAGSTVEESVFDDGRLHIHLGLREVTLNGEAVPLSRKEYALLALLLKHAGRVVTQPQCARRLCPPTKKTPTTCASWSANCARNCRTMPPPRITSSPNPAWGCGLSG